MNRIDHEKLLDELLTPDGTSDLRQRSLQQGLMALRRDRRRRHVLRICASLCLPVLAVAVFLFSRAPGRHPRVHNSTPSLAVTSSPRPADSPVKMISDEELFALFPGRSLALIGKPGQQKLVFLDEPAVARSGAPKIPENRSMPKSDLKPSSSGQHS